MNSQGSTSEGRARPSALLALAFTIGFALLVAASAGPAQAKYSQPSCGKFAKQVGQAKDKGRKAKAKRNLKACKANRLVYGKVKDSRFVGTREDGESIDITLCANGLAVDDYDSAYEEVMRGGWKIQAARVEGRHFEAGFAAKIPGGERVGALRFDEDGWGVGIFSLGSLDTFGPAQRTDAKAICGKL